MQPSQWRCLYLKGSDRPLSRTGAFALLLSGVGSPFLTPLYTVGIVVGSLVDNPQQFLLWAGLISIFLSGAALGYVVVQVVRGKISDFHVSQQSQRHMPFLVAICSNILGVGVLWWMAAPWIFLALGSSFAIQGVFFGVLTRFRKISMHVAVLASCITGLVVLFGWVAVPLFAFLPLQGWARVYRGRHTLGQVVAAALLAPLLTILILIPWWLAGAIG
jgi:hypothetical protein